MYFYICTNKSCELSSTAQAILLFICFVCLICVCVCGGGGGGWLFALLVFVGGVFYFSLWENKQITLF